VAPASTGHGLELLHTADLTPPMLDALRVLLEESFDDWTVADSDHTFGGIHAIVWDDGVPVAHGALVQRMLLLGDKPLRTGYLEGVAVHPNRRRTGYGSAVMTALESLGSAAYPLLALSASDSARRFYEKRDWLRWAGPTSVMSPSGMVRTPDDDGGVFVRSAVAIDTTKPIACDWRAGDVW
jgi:aminoglycoside 2'-N-acetyltransferase I